MMRLSGFIMKTLNVSYVISFYSLWLTLVSNWMMKTKEQSLKEVEAKQYVEEYFIR
jgi:hypothetical protein